jgi:hypothetical protein
MILYRGLKMDNQPTRLKGAEQTEHGLLGKTHAWRLSNSIPLKGNCFVIISSHARLMMS